MADINTQTDITAVEGAGGRLTAVLAHDRAADRDLRFEPAGAFIFVGLLPNSDFVRGVVDLDPQGFVRTNDHYETSLPGLFAAGDVRAGSTKQVGSAVGEGIAALLAVGRYLQERGQVAGLVPGGAAQA